MKQPTNRNELAPFITVQMAQERYNLSRGGVMKLAKESNSLITFGRAQRINVANCDKFFIEKYTM
jgi:hypothetical protein